MCGDCCYDLTKRASLKYDNCHDKPLSLQPSMRNVKCTAAFKVRNEPQKVVV